MYSSEELERFYVDYQSEWVPRGMTLRAYCDRNNVPYKVMENFMEAIGKKIVPVEVVGRPGQETPSTSTRQASPQPPAASRQQEQPKSIAGRISVFIRFGDGTEVSRKGLDYAGLKVLVSKLEVLC